MYIISTWTQNTLPFVIFVCVVSPCPDCWAAVNIMSGAPTLRTLAADITLDTAQSYTAQLQLDSYTARCFYEVLCANIQPQMV